MSDELRLLGVIALIYLADCLYWIPGNGIGLTQFVGALWRVRFPSGLFGNDKGALGLANPLPPLGIVSRAQGIPISLSPEGVLSYLSTGFNEGGRPPQENRFVGWKDIQKIEREGKKVFLNGGIFYQAVSGYAARRVAEQISQVRAASEKERVLVIQSLLSDAFNAGNVRKRLNDYCENAGALKWLGNILFFFLFVTTPLAVAAVGLPRAIWYLVAALLVQTFTIAILFRRAHKRLYPQDSEEIFKPFLTMLLAPPSAIRAADLLCRPLLERFNPLTATSALAGKPSLERLASLYLRDLSFPRLPILPLDSSPAAQGCESWFREATRGAAEALLEKLNCGASKLLRAPAPTDPEHCQYCPRCLQQFTAQAKNCPDCGGRDLRLLETFAEVKMRN